VHDAKARRHHTKGVEGLHAPLHELVPLAVAVELQLHVQVQRVRRAVVVHRHRVVHHQVHRHQRLDALGILAQSLRHAAHGSQVGQQGHAGEVLQHHARHRERDLLGALGVGLPAGQLLHVRGRHPFAIAMAQHALQHDAQRLRQSRDRRELARQLGQRIEAALLTRGRLEGPQGGREGMRGAIKGIHGSRSWQWSSAIVMGDRRAAKASTVGVGWAIGANRGRLAPSPRPRRTNMFPLSKRPHPGRASPTRPPWSRRAERRCAPSLTAPAWATPSACGCGCGCLCRPGRSPRTICHAFARRRMPQRPCREEGRWTSVGSPTSGWDLGPAIAQGASPVEPAC